MKPNIKSVLYANKYRKRQRMITITLSKFIRVRELGIGKIVGIFTHRRRNLRCLFVVVTLAEGNFKHLGIIESAQDPDDKTDAVLFAPTFCLTDKRIIVGLPSIDPLPVCVSARVNTSALRQLGWICR